MPGMSTMAYYSYFLESESISLLWAFAKACSALSITPSIFPPIAPFFCSNFTPAFTIWSAACSFLLCTTQKTWTLLMHHLDEGKVFADSHIWQG